MADFEIQTPDGRGTIVGMTPDRKRVLVMHTRYEGKKRFTYAKWWDWDYQKGEIIERDTDSTESDKENSGEDEQRVPGDI